MDELQRRRIIRKGDKVVFDKGYYKHDNYIMGISRYKIVPLIFSRKNTNLKKIPRQNNLPTKRIIEKARYTNESKKLF